MFVYWQDFGFSIKMQKTENIHSECGAADVFNDGGNAQKLKI